MRPLVRAAYHDQPGQSTHAKPQAGTAARIVSLKGRWAKRRRKTMHPIVEHLERTDLVALWGNEIHVPATLFRYEFKTGIAPSKLGKGG